MLFIKMPTVTVAVWHGTGTCANTFRRKSRREHIFQLKITGVNVK
jgi:hypothetical protein